MTRKNPKEQSSPLPPSSVTLPLPASLISSISDQVNVCGDYHMIILITDKHLALVGARDIEPERNIRVGRKGQFSGIVIITVHLNFFCNLIAVCKVSGFSQSVDEVFVLPGCCNIHEEQRPQYSNVVIT